MKHWESSHKFCLVIRQLSMSSQPSSSSYTRRCCPRWSSRRKFMLRLLKKSSSSFVQYIVFVCYSRESSLKVCLDSSPCPRCPPPPLILSIVALRGGVGEGGEPGPHQARHHLPVVVVVTSWNTESNKTLEERKKIYPIDYLSHRFDQQLTSLSRQDWNIWGLLGLVESLTWKTVQHVGRDTRAAVLGLWWKRDLR